MKMHRALLLALLAFVATGCATILNDKTQSVNILSSNGKPVEGTIDGVPFKGPGSINVTRSGSDKAIVATTPGCSTAILTKSVDPKFFLNAITIYSTLSWSTTDAVTEKMWRYQDTVVIPCQ